MALLLGSDYTEGISGIGIVNAIEVVRTFHEDDGLKKFKEWVDSPDASLLDKVHAHEGKGSRKRSKSSKKTEHAVEEKDEGVIQDESAQTDQEDELSEDRDLALKKIFMAKHARGILLKRIHKCIKERREHPEVLRNDLLTKIVREGTFSDEIIADTIIFFVFASVETSVMAMTFAVKYLTENPRALEELRAEHEALLKAKGKGNEKLTWNDYQSMKFVHCEYFIVELQCWHKS